ncbi:MAG: tRNA uridine-5-carboxymethylaminomethyl(34) synthesis enzyme MnmG [Muribaculaceae bacterium]|nr:tRNA uridine-5-carboxymethylaminomethyl(34) synthesis enzyme MnmG [Muribaculaceae bacterium]MBO7165401.1 tRNA uridine-5-carboxymethylaminomethyl(34) synthesis enzyme MnmG [Muribaculaceae bacterium]
MRFEYDVIVIGAGHAGCEAAAAAARLGSETLLITSDMNRIAQMSCNPAVGGIAKGQIVREVDALGGQMGIVTDRTAVQFRMLNRSKGPAMWSPRAQSDRTRFIDEWRKILDATPGLYIFQDTATEFVFDQKSENGRPVVTGVKTLLGLTFKAKSVVLTAGTFLNGLLHFGETQIPGGRISEPASYGLTEQLKAIGFETQRMKTGTPARIDGRTVNFSLAQAQSGDDAVSTDADGNVSVARDFHKFSFLPKEGRTLMPRECWIVHTNPDVHRRLHDNLDRSPLYNGQIQSIGPRYCPSIETKIVTFADKDSHQLFLEPEGETTEEYYINGFSSSLPWDVQIDALKQVEALKDVHFYRPGYAIEYDYFDPTQLRHTLQTKLVDGLFFAGQVNGTTGYEEAAGQGLIAGVNAHNYVKNLPDFVLKRDEAYIGVLIDDLVTKGVDEPYRMFTSRAEYRILLRQDDADMRLTPRGYEIGLVTEERYQLMVEKRRQRDELIEFCRGFLVKADKINPHLPALGCVELKASQRLYDLILRPQLDFEKLRRLIPALDRQIMSIEEERRSEIVESAEILIKYSGYIERERLLADKIQRLENLPLGDKIDYDQILSLSTEARQKLAKIRPATIAQASRIPGISPADINILLMLLGR